jgi:hypothetical protein
MALTITMIKTCSTLNVTHPIQLGILVDMECNIQLENAHYVEINCPQYRMQRVYAV